MEYQQLLTKMYASFNRRDIDAVLVCLADDVEWPNGWEGGWLHGRAEVRAYWERQWREIDPRVEPIAFAEETADTVRVTVHQVVRNLAGAIQFDGVVGHVYEFTNAVVRRMTIQTP